MLTCFVGVVVVVVVVVVVIVVVVVAAAAAARVTVTVTVSCGFHEAEGANINPLWTPKMVPHILSCLVEVSMVEGVKKDPECRACTKRGFWKMRDTWYMPWDPRNDDDTILVSLWGPSLYWKLQHAAERGLQSPTALPKPQTLNHTTDPKQPLKARPS